MLSATLRKIYEGKGSATDLETIRDVTEVMETSSLCSLGKTAINPVRTSMKYFGDEWDAHIEDKACPAKHCKPLINYTIARATRVNASDAEPASTSVSSTPW